MIFIASIVTIDGGGAVTLSGGNVTPLFLVFGTLTLRNVTVTNGFGPDDGGAVLNEIGGTLVLDTVTVRDNQAGLGGGAVFGVRTAPGTRDFPSNACSQRPDRPEDAVQVGLPALTPLLARKYPPLDEPVADR